MVRLEMKNYNMILTEKHQKYQHYHPEKLINMNVKEISPFNQTQVIEQAKFRYSPLGRALEKQTEKQVDDIKVLYVSDRCCREFNIYYFLLYLF